MKVIQLLPNLNEGGVERGTVEMNREFSRRGIDSFVGSAGGKLVNCIENDGGRHVNLSLSSKNILSFPLRIIHLRKVLKDLRPDIIHARSRIPAWLTKLAKVNVPFITTVHGINSVNFYSRVMSLGDQVICVGEPVRDHIVRNYKTDLSKITVIPRGVDISYFDPDAVDNEKVDQFVRKLDLKNKFTICSVGRITRKKDYETLISAIGRLDTPKRNVRVIIIGGARTENDSYAKNLKNKASYVCPGKFEWLGSRQDMREIYASSDVVVNSSPLMGNVARTITEAIAMGKPVISTSMMGLNHVIKDGINGYLFEQGSVLSLKEKLELLISKPIINTRGTLPSEFTLNSMVESTVEVYKNALRR